MNFNIYYRIALRECNYILALMGYDYLMIGIVDEIKIRPAGGLLAY